MRITVTACCAMMIAILTVSCLTTGVVQKAHGRSAHYAAIKQIKGAGLRDDRLFLQLGIQVQGDETLHTVVFSMPLADVGTYRSTNSAASYQANGLSLMPPQVGRFEPSPELPAGIVNLTPEYLDVRDHLDLDDRIYALPEGTHILVVRTLYGRSAQHPMADFAGDGTLPPEGNLILVRSASGHAPRQGSLPPFGETPKKHRAWLFLTPFSVIGDIVTCPFQLIILLVGSGC